MESQRDLSSVWPHGALHSTDRAWSASQHYDKCLPVLAEILYDLQQNDSETTEEYLAFIVAEVALGERP